MPSWSSAFLCVPVLLFLLSSGCTSIDVGSAGYGNGTISLGVTNAGPASDGYIQVTVYAIRENLQTETGTYYAPLRLEPGSTIARIPATLSPGQYKLYCYIIQNGERKTAAIRDIVVS